jgi:hypothetical protein
MEQLPPNIKKTVMSTADIFVEKGKKIGLEEGRKEKTEKSVRNMLREGSTMEFICKVLAVTPDYVARIRKELDKI